MLVGTVRKACRQPSSETPLVSRDDDRAHR
jgi:hypothetical protein